jgi:hypothetical protein
MSEWITVRREPGMTFESAPIYDSLEISHAWSVFAAGAVTYQLGS